MLIDKNDRAPHDLTRVGLDEEWQVRYWCTRFGVGTDELRACVLEVGPVAENVEKQLKQAGRQVFQKMGED